MKTVKQIDGRFWRKAAEDVWARTVFGNRELKTFICRTCKGTGYYSEAYLDSKRKNGIRPYHASCWNQFNGKTFSRLVAKRDEPTATLELFV